MLEIEELKISQPRRVNTTVLRKIIDGTVQKNNNLEPFAKIMFGYFEHIEILQELLSKEVNGIQSFRILERKKRLEEYIRILTDALPLKVKIYYEINERIKNLSKRELEIYLDKFEQRGVYYDYKEYWNPEKFFQLPPNSREILKEKIKKSLTPENIKKQMKLAVFKTISLPGEILGSFGAVILSMISENYNIEDWENRKKWYDKYK